jgi:hypothetical protein
MYGFWSVEVKVWDPLLMVHDQEVGVAFVVRSVNKRAEPVQAVVLSA